MDYQLVTAQECNKDGTMAPQVLRVKLEINKDLIAAKMGELLFLKPGPVVQLGDKYFMDFKIEEKEVKTMRRVN